MKTLETIDHSDPYEKTIFGFWVYLMTDCILFATFFTAYAVLHKNTDGGLSSKELFNLPYALTETLILLISSFTCGLGFLSLQKGKKNQVIGWFAITFLLGLSFLVMELMEFTHLVQSGNSWQRNAFLSSFFALVSTHGLHITFGLIWILVMIVQVAAKDLTSSTIRRITCLSLFWHFLDLIWIFIFTFVYLLGVSP